MSWFMTAPIKSNSNATNPSATTHPDSLMCWVLSISAKCTHAYREPYCQIVIETRWAASMEHAGGSFGVWAGFGAVFLVDNDRWKLA